MAESLIWKEDPDTGDLTAYARANDDPETDRKVTWAPQPGSQEAFLSCPVFETLLHGSRGGGKTDVLLMDFAQEVGKGYGAEWRGVIFRRTYPELQDVIEKAKKWFTRLHPQSNYHETKHEWQWPSGEKLLFRHAMAPSDYWKYHGAAFTFIGWEELTTWPDLDLYLKMMSLCRSTVKSIPRKYRATTNPHGVGHNAVKARFKLGGENLPVGEIIKDEETGQERVSITSTVYENRVLLHADPGYLHRIAASAPNEAVLKAWMEGNWDVVAGGMLDDRWDAKYHVIPSFPHKNIPRGWRIDRSYDHGQSRPFAVGWFAESDGTPMELTRTTYSPDGPLTETITVGQVKGDVIMFDEYYGCVPGKWNTGVFMDGSEIAAEIRKRQELWEIHERVQPGPADNAIFDPYTPGKSVAGDMKRRPHGIRWTRSDKSSGSRVQGWQTVRRYLAGAIPEGGKRTQPGLFVCDRCEAFIQTVPNLPRDERNPDDVDTKSTDHVGDMLRYRLRKRSFAVQQEDF